jgi:hypothetical protein
VEFDHQIALEFDRALLMGAEFAVILMSVISKSFIIFLLHPYRIEMA